MMFILSAVAGAVIGGSLATLYVAMIFANPRDDWNDKDK